MKLDRELIKSQAKQLIKGRVLTLFLIIFVVSALCNGSRVIVNVSNSIKNAPSNPFQKGYSYNIDNFDDLEDYIESYQDSQDAGKSKNSGLTGTAASLGNIINLICMPLMIMLSGLFLLLIRGTALGLADEFTYVFKNTFNKDYFDKFLLMFLKGLFTFLWALLLIVPGVIYYYKVSFAEYIKADYPDLTWKDCLELSKKMTNNHKGELFVLDLSYILWGLLVAVTFGIALIYVLPYYQTARALYYENFKRRALATGEMNENDFMTESQKYAQFVNLTGRTDYNVQPSVQNSYQAPVNNAAQQPYSAPAQMPYQPYEQSVESAAQTYYQPVTPAAVPVQPAQQTYYQAPPVQQPVQQAQPINNALAPAQAPAPFEAPAPVETPVQPEFSAPAEEPAPIEEAPAVYPAEPSEPTEDITDNETL